VIGTRNAAEAENTLHFHYGATWVSSWKTPFATLSSSMWTNSFTPTTYSQLVSNVQPGSNALDELLVKASDGSIVALGLTTTYTYGHTSSPVLVVVLFNFQQSGFSLTGL
jgi:hypothetical protein